MPDAAGVLAAAERGEPCGRQGALRLAQVPAMHIDRLTAVEVERLQFKRPADFDASLYLAGSLGIFRGDGPLQSVRMHFGPAVSRVVAERSVHPSQRLLPQPDGSLVAEFELSSFEELTSWILSFGAHAEVLEPAELRAEIAAEVATLAKTYATNGARKRGTIQERLTANA